MSVMLKMFQEVESTVSMATVVPPSREFGGNAKQVPKQTPYNNVTLCPKYKLMSVNIK